MQIKIKGATDTIQVGKLAYGTFITGVTSHPHIVYQKINKKNTGAGINIRVPERHSLLLNIELGTLRVVPGDMRVEVYEAALELTKTTDFGPHLKDAYTDN